MGPLSLRAAKNWFRQAVTRRPSRKLNCERLEDRHVPTAVVGLEAAGLSLVKFDTATPGTTTTVGVTGLAADEFLVSIDFRPSDNKLYGLALE